MSTGIATAQVISLPKTGQTSCYDVFNKVIPCAGTGQDGEIQAGVSWPAPRFVLDVSGNCVTDKLTGLMWVRNPYNALVEWSTALSYTSSLSLCGYDDWRIPNANELESLVHAGESSPAAWLNSQGFTNVKLGYWTSTTYTPFAPVALEVDFSNGTVVGSNKRTMPNYVWAVRNSLQPKTIELPKTGQTTCYDVLGNIIPCAGTGQDGELQTGVAWPAPRFTVNGDCIIDNLTDLMWPRNGNLFGRRGWQDALNDANNLTLCGHTDWRLPNRRELNSLLNYGESDNAAWLNAQGFMNVQPYYAAGVYGDYWTSTTWPIIAGYAWIVNLADGRVMPDVKYFLKFVLPVRGGILAVIPTNPQVAITVNQATVSPGQTLLLSATTIPGTQNNVVDGYVKVVIPGGGTYYLLPDLKTWSPTPTPVVSNFTVVAYTGPIYTTVVPTGLPAGSYTFSVFGVTPGSDPNNPANLRSNVATISVTLSGNY